MNLLGRSNIFGRIVNGIFRFTGWVVMLLLATISIVMLIQVFSRYLLNAPLTWPEELSRYLFIWVVFLGAALAFRHKAHLGMDFVTARMSEKLRHVTAKLVEVLILGFLVLIIYIAPQVLGVTMFQTSPVLNIPMSYVYLAFPVAAGLMIIELFNQWFFSTGSRHADPAKE